MRTVLAGTVLVLLVLSGVILLFGLHPTADSFAPDSFAVTLRNDTSNPVVLKQCDVDCTSFHEAHRLAPGGSVQVNASPPDSDNWWVMASDTGTAQGCLDLRYNHAVDNAVVDVSAAHDCPRAHRGPSRVATAASFAIIIAFLFVAVWISIAGRRRKRGPQVTS